MRCLFAITIFTLAVLASVSTQEDIDNPVIPNCPLTKRAGISIFNCSGIDIEHLPEVIPDDAQVLDFSKNDFTTFPYIAESPHCHYSCGVSNASNHCRLSISFRENDIENFEEHALHSLKCLQTLDVSYNDITADVFHPAFFEEGAYYIERLILRNNPLGTLPDNVITHPFMPLLKYLDLADCRLTSMGRNSVDGLYTLQVLNLSYNQLSDIHQDTFKGLTHLKTLDLSENRLTYFSENVFGDLQNLQELILSGNRIKGLHDNSFYEGANLMYFDLSNNFFDEIPYEVLGKLKNLHTLDFSRNPMKDISKGATEDDAPEVQKLILDNMPNLKEIKTTDFYVFNDLRSLSISGCKSLNKISFGKYNTAYFLRRLKNLRLENNWLTTLVSDALPWQQLEELHLGGNPWLCDADLEWIVQAKNNPIEGSVICAAPAHLRGKDLRKLTADQLQEEYSVLPIVALVVTIIAVPVVCACAVFVYKRRRFCACAQQQGQYVSVFTRDVEEQNDERVDIRIKENAARIQTVSNGGADDTKHLVKLDENGHLTAALADEEEEI